LPAAIAIGSNVGDRASHIAFAVTRLRRLMQNLSVSSTYETVPLDMVGPQRMFLNAAAVGECALPARALLDVLLEIERERGRERPFAGAARTLDLDLVLYDDQQIDEPGLTVPHPRFRERRFVLEPLTEIAPGLRDPVTGATVEELFTRLPPAGATTRQ
jgi:2-amino-4-hydroxy-6-hydroxymethyldihydropteridine diphosphokinase